MFGHYRFRTAQSGLIEHQHKNAIEICFLLRGEQTYRVGRKTYRLRGGDQFVTFPNEWHDTAGEPQRGELYWIILEARPQKKNALFLDAKLRRRLLGGLSELPLRSFRAAPDAAMWLGQIESSLSSRGSGRQLLAACALHQYLLGTIQAATKALERSPGQRVREAMNWMESHLDEPVRLAEMAREIGWSEAHFKDAFRRETGHPPHEYFTGRKISAAIYMLTREKRPVTEVAMALGFSSSQHFATAFRKFTGHTPSETRAGVRARSRWAAASEESSFTRMRNESAAKK